MSVCGDPDPALHALYTRLCVSAARRRTALVLAIEDGARGVGKSNVLQCLTETALARDAESAFYSIELAELVPLRAADEVVPTEGVPHEGDGSVGTWALKMGYARDRVVGYNRIKAAMLDVHNLSAGPEMQVELFRVWGRVNGLLRTTEAGLVKRTDTVVDSVPLALHAKRKHWERAALNVPDAQRQQPKLLEAPAMLGYTAEELQALAADPELANEATAAAGRLDEAATAARDAKMGTELFVSVVFPAVDSRQLAAAGAVDGLLETGGATGVATPGMVTMHNATGAVVMLLPAVTDRGANAFVTDDAALLLARVHALARCMLLEHGAL